MPAEPLPHDKGTDKPHAVCGLLAHVDAGKTTLAETLMYHAGVIRTRGRTDHGNSHLDTHDMERERGITIFSSQVGLDLADACITLLDAPGHVDFCTEAERTLTVLDLAVLVIGANDGVTGYTNTLWRLLSRYEVPTVVFVNKMDLANASKGELMRELQERLSADCVDASDPTSTDLHEALAQTDEDALDEYLEVGELSLRTARRLVAQRKAFPCLFGSALRDQGVAELADALCALVPERTWPSRFAAQVYKVSHDGHERLSWLKVTGGTLHAKDLVRGTDGNGPWADKVDQIRLYAGDKFQVCHMVEAGRICAVCGLDHVLPGDALGAQKPADLPVLTPVLTYKVDTKGLDAHTVYQALRELAEEDPLLGVSWDEQLGEICLQLMGTVQLEVMRERLGLRLGTAVDFGMGSILYKETVTAPVMAYGHFEPLRHYAEVHFRIEPLPAKSGVVWGSVCSTDDLDLNWQRLALGCAMEREHRGALAGAPLTDVRITLVSGRAHLKHTEGGDFRQAAWRAIRQGLMCAREQGVAQLLEPWYALELEVPASKVGRAMADLTRMHARFGTPAMRHDMALLRGSVAASEVGNYALEVAAYTGGSGSLSLEPTGYEPCHDANDVIERKAYDPKSDPAHTPDSVFCTHGAGYAVSWREAANHMHVHDDPSRERPWHAADAKFFGRA